MADDTEQQQTDAPTDQQQTDTTTEQAPTAKSRSRAKARDDDAPTKQKCAACGKTAVFTEHSNVGGHHDLTYHDCEKARALVHEYAVASSSDTTLEPPVLAAQ